MCYLSRAACDCGAGRAYPGDPRKRPSFCLPRRVSEIPRRKDGRIIRDLDDATSFAREQEVRPGVDQRDEVLHKMEHAKSKEEAHAAAHSFVRWLEELEILE